MKYDCTEDVKKHKKQVFNLMNILIGALQYRQKIHDDTKLLPPEKEYFDTYTPKLINLTYGSKEYDKMRKKMYPALKHHYKYNSHHPEHYKNGINDMDLVDLIEMLCDWVASTEKEKNGNISNSLKITKKRFKISNQLANIFRNTIRRRFNE